MNRYKIFLASSAELKAEREKIEQCIGRLNGDWADRQIFLDLRIWENADHGGALRSQDDYNRDLQECPVFLLLFYSKVGKFTREEFEAAKTRHLSGGLPRIFIFQKDADLPKHQSEEDALSRFAFLKTLKEEDHFPILFPGPGELLHELETRLNKLLKEGFFVGSPKDQNPSSRVEPLVESSRLPYDSNAKLFGREKELALLDAAWENPKTHLVELHAMGGAGKTALVGHWLDRLAERDYGGAKRVYAWSFYSQGAGEQRQSTAEPFIVAMLRWYGEDPAGLPLSPTDRGRLLAKYIRQERTLLLLDGLEPLQHPPGPEEGKLKDPGLATMLRELAAQNSGLCVLTTRIPVADLARWREGALYSHALEHLDAKAGADLLEFLGVKGSRKELERVVEKEYEGHALALLLLGQYLRDVYRGDLQRRDRIRQLTREEKRGAHAKRVLEAYVHWFEADGHYLPELTLLRLVGLFDRPAPVGALDALLGDSGLEPQCAPLLQADPERQIRAFKHLERLSLLRGNTAEKVYTPPVHLSGLEGWESLDAHPLVREFFGEKLELEQSDAFRQAHSVLYDYYRNLPEKELPDALEEMEPLFAAVMHGCRAGKQKDAFAGVYWRRICRKTEAYSIHKLGALGSDLTALSWFFERLWDIPLGNLTELWQARVCSWAGFRLQALGRLVEAAQPMQAAQEIFKRNKDWKSATINASNLSGLYLTYGNIPQAVRLGNECTEYADQSGDDWQIFVVGLTTHAYALDAAGNGLVAEILYRKAEQMQQKYQPHLRFLYSIYGFWYCDYLLSGDRCDEVLERAEFSSEISKQNNQLLSIAFGYLSLGKAYTLLFQKRLDPDNYMAAAQCLNAAVAGLEKANHQDDIPRGFLARAHFHRLCNNYPQAQQDLTAAHEIAAPAGMRLHLCDYHLESARLNLAMHQKDQAQEHTAAAAKLVQETGYHRRDAEVAELEQALKEA